MKGLSVLLIALVVIVLTLDCGIEARRNRYQDGNNGLGKNDKTRSNMKGSEECQNCRQKSRETKKIEKENNPDCSEENRELCFEFIKNNDEYNENCQNNKPSENCKNIKNKLIQTEIDCEGYKKCREAIEDAKENMLETDQKCMDCEICRNCQKSIRFSVKEFRNNNLKCNDREEIKKCFTAIKNNPNFDVLCGKKSRNSNKEVCESFRESEPDCEYYNNCHDEIEAIKTGLFETDENCIACEDIKDQTD